MNLPAHDQHDANRPETGRWIFWAFVLIAGYFVVTEHRAHLIEYLPFVLLLACPLLHLFHRHGGHEKTGHEH